MRFIDYFSFMVRQAGLEPTAYCLEGSCSIQLSYWRIRRDKMHRNAGDVKRLCVHAAVDGKTGSIMRQRRPSPKKTGPSYGPVLEAPPRFELGIKVLQTSALPLGDGALQNTIIQ
jgi:hypothetical protein